jgi:hypothetical protein
MDRDYCEGITLTRSRGWYTVREHDHPCTGGRASRVVNFGNRPVDRAFWECVLRQVEERGYERVEHGSEIRFRRAGRGGVGEGGPPVAGKAGR